MAEGYHYITNHSASSSISVFPHIHSGHLLKPAEHLRADEGAPGDPLTYSFNLYIEAQSPSTAMNENFFSLISLLVISALHW
jgi:hypothetical protein